MKFKNASEVKTAPIVATGLIGGWLTARETGVRPLGGALLAAAGVWAARSWYAKGGVPLAAGLSTAYIAAFGLSHPLAKKIGAWPAVLAVTSGVAGAALALSDTQ
ncbi:hypothetical protein [Corynebacterium sp.]|uniref:hypothetical protein n=1 Tax=Corynebacterium sp. TaxID=1720 RepID=UPI0026DB8D16|nr:hypothetical protein [Corynebacterium sp.]MDO5076624.1 hypothetical protein [Corynebacterium sp.]